MSDKYTSNYIFKRMDQIDSYILNESSYNDIIEEFMNEYDYDPITKMLKINGIEASWK